MTNRLIALQVFFLSHKKPLDYTLSSNAGERKRHLHGVRLALMPEVFSKREAGLYRGAPNSFRGSSENESERMQH